MLIAGVNHFRDMRRAVSQDGVLDASDAEFANFKVMVTNADGSTEAKTLAQLNITSININNSLCNKPNRFWKASKNGKIQKISLCVAATSGF